VGVRWFRLDVPNIQHCMDNHKLLKRTTAERFSDDLTMVCHFLEIVFGSEAQAGILQIAFIAPFQFAYWIYQKVKWRFFKPNSMVLYAMMIERIELNEWFIQSMKAKGWTNEEELAYRKLCS
jgi:hypothetical protein